MKVLFKILFTFIFLFFLQGTSNPNISCELPSASNYIQNYYEKTFLVTQSSNQSEMYAEANNKSKDLSSGKNFVIGDSFATLASLRDNTPDIIPGFIHNLSTNLHSEISIRAP